MSYRLTDPWSAVAFAVVEFIRKPHEDPMKWFDKHNCLSRRDVFPAKTGSWGRTYRRALSVLNSYSNHLLHAIAVCR